METAQAAAIRNVPIVSLFPRAPGDGGAPVVVGKYVALDCEMVGVGPDGVEHALARVSMVNWHGQVILDTFVRPSERVTDFRTAVSGVRPSDLRDAPSLVQVQQWVSDLLLSGQPPELLASSPTATTPPFAPLKIAQTSTPHGGSPPILIGHSLMNDFKVLLLNHPRKLTRDTSKYRPFRQLSRGKTPSLKRLALEVLGLRIQEGEHDSVDDARVAMLLYQSCKDEWENYLFRNEGRTFKQQKKLKKNQQKQEKCETC